MNSKSLQSHPLLTGTLLLTIAGLISRIIGFFYRIFLSQTIGAEGVGIYQLIFPLYALTFSLTVSGIQTAISRFTAQAVAASDNTGISSYMENGINGFIFKTNDSHELSDTITHVVQNFQSMESIKNEGRKIYDSFFSEPCFEHVVRKIFKFETVSA